MKYNTLILHGTDAAPESNWFNWLKKSMKKHGKNVWLPQLPNAKKPNSMEYNKFIFENQDMVFDQETTIIGHSSGAVAILSLIQNLSKETIIGDIFLVSAFHETERDALAGLFFEEFDYELIRSKVKSITIVHSTNDPYIPLSQAEFLAEKLSAELVIVPDQGHFNLENSLKYSTFPLLMQKIDLKENLTRLQKLKIDKDRIIIPLNLL